MTVIQMSHRELSRLRVVVDLTDGRLTVDAAAKLMGVGRRQVFRLRRAFETIGASGLISKKRGRPSNRKHGETFRRTVLDLIGEHYVDFGPTLTDGATTEKPSWRRRCNQSSSLLAESLPRSAGYGLFPIRPAQSTRLN